MHKLLSNHELIGTLSLLTTLSNLWYTYNVCKYSFSELILSVFLSSFPDQRCDCYTPLHSEHLLHSFVVAANIL